MPGICDDCERFGKGIATALGIEPGDTTSDGLRTAIFREMKAKLAVTETALAARDKRWTELRAWLQPTRTGLRSTKQPAFAVDVLAKMAELEGGGDNE